MKKLLLRLVLALLSLAFVLPLPALARADAGTDAPAGLSAELPADLPEAMVAPGPALAPPLRGAPAGGWRRWGGAS